MHLEDLIQAAAITQDKRRKRLITCLKRAEELRHCYSLVRSITKPRQQGGLSHVNIPKETTPPAPPQWDAIYDPQELERLVLKQHQTHFSQANGTIFTINPLRSLIDDECTSPFAQQVLQGTVDIESQPIDTHTKTLLKHLKKKTEPDENPTHKIDPEAIIQGFKLWPERTSTSPSGRHLGIYKSLAKHFPPPTDPKAPTPPTPPDPIQGGTDILKLMIHMMDLAITHTHTYDRWRTGNPQIDRLRTIHLYEADYNLLLKWFSSQGFIIRSEKAQHITDNQGGGHPGRSAMDLALTKVLSYKAAETLHLRVIIVDNDAMACFD